MRLSEKEVRSGYFWMPRKPDDKLPGTLTVTNGGNVRLEVLGKFVDEVFFVGASSAPRIVGLVEDGGFVTLEECAYVRRTLSDGSIAKSEINAHLAVIGVAFNENEPLLVESLRFSVDGLDQWYGISGIEVDEMNLKDRRVTIRYAEQENRSLNLSDDLQIVLGLTWSIPMPSRHSHEAKISEITHITIRPSKLARLGELLPIVRKLVNFLCFATDATVSIRDMTASIRIDKEPVTAKVFYPSVTFSEKEPTVSWHQMLFLFTQIQSSAESVVKAWFKAYDIIEPTMNLYFAARMRAFRFVEGRFLSLVQALESYHRRRSDETVFEAEEYDRLTSSLLKLAPPEHVKWLASRLRYGNELSLSVRLKKIIEPFHVLFCAEN